MVLSAGVLRSGARVLCGSDITTFNLAKLSVLLLSVSTSLSLSPSTPTALSFLFPHPLLALLLPSPPPLLQAPPRMLTHSGESEFSPVAVYLGAAEVAAKRSRRRELVRGRRR